MSNEWLDAIKDVMERRQMKQSELAREIGVNQGYIANILAGRYESGFTTAQQIERILGVSMDLWCAHRGVVPDDLRDRYGVAGLAAQFQRMRKDTYV